MRLVNKSHKYRNERNKMPLDIVNDLNCLFVGIINLQI